MLWRQASNNSVARDTKQEPDSRSDICFDNRKLHSRRFYPSPQCTLYANTSPSKLRNNEDSGLVIPANGLIHLGINVARSEGRGSPMNHDRIIPVLRNRITSERFAGSIGSLSGSLPVKCETSIIVRKGYEETSDAAVGGPDRADDVAQVCWDTSVGKEMQLARALGIDNDTVSISEDVRHDLENHIRRCAQHTSRDTMGVHTDNVWRWKSYKLL